MVSNLILRPRIKASILLLLLTLFAVDGADENHGQFVVEINPNLAFILCSPTKEEHTNSIMRLMNVNDVYENAWCIESSLLDSSKDGFVFDSSQSPPILRKHSPSDGQRQKPSEISVRIHEITGGVYHFELGSQYLTIEFLDELTKQIPLSPTSPQIVVSNENPLEFTWIRYSESPFIPSTKFKTDMAVMNEWDMTDADECSNTFPFIGKRVQIDGKMGIITYHIMASNSCLVEFRDGSIGWYDNIDFDNVHVEYPVGTLVDAYWPADRLKLTNLADVLWPAKVTNYSNTSDSYTLRYEDGSIHPSVPSIYIKYPQKQCIDDRADCPILAKEEQCRMKPAFAMIHCRKSCGVCTRRVDDESTEDSTNIVNDHTFFTLRAVNSAGSVVVDDTEYVEDLTFQFQSSVNTHRMDEARSLNKMGERLMLYGNIDLAEQYFLRSSFAGSNDAKFNLGHIYSITDGREAEAVLYLYFSAMAGSLSGNLALGYRHLFGYGVPKSCEIAANYYQKAANTLFGSQNSPFNPMEQQNIEMIRLQDDARRDSAMKETDEVIRYYHSHANNGDASSQIALGQLYYYGLRGFDQNFETAISYFNQAAKQDHADAYAMLGHIYVDGIEELGIPKNLAKAIEYYKKAIDGDSVSGHTGMGFLQLEGIPDEYGAFKKNATAALEHFRFAAKKHDLSAVFYLGLMYFNGIGMKKASYHDAFECFMSAARNGHAQSLYYAGYMHLNGLVTAKSCKMAVELFKMSAERSVIAKQLSAARGYYLDSEYDRAYYMYSKLAVQGFEIAQSNVGWLLKRNLVSRDMLYLNAAETNDYNTSTLELARRAAFRYFEWSANQNNADSQRIVGDYYYYDYLNRFQEKREDVDEERADYEPPIAVKATVDRYAEAGNYYEMSAENTLGGNAQSMFNLGYMHQYGIGKQKDFSMAKRYYDLSKQNGPSGSMACYIYLAALYYEHFMEDFSPWTVEMGIPRWMGGATVKYYAMSLKNDFWYYAQDWTMENIALTLMFVALIIVLAMRH